MRWQLFKRVEVRNHCTGSMKCPHKVLPLRSVDAGLATNRRINHSRNRRRHVNDVDAAKPGCGSEACEVRRCAASHPNDQVASREVA